MPTSSPGEGRLRESKPPRQLILLAFPTHWTVGGISTGGTSSPGGRAASGRADPRASSFFWLSPHTGPWEVSPRGDVIPRGEGRLRESKPVPALSSGFPHTLDRGRYLHGGTSSPGEGRIRESKPPRWLPLQALPITPDRGGYPRPEGGYLGRAVSGRVNPRASSFFWLSPYTGPWEVSPRGDVITLGGPAPGE